MKQDKTFLAAAGMLPARLAGILGQASAEIQAGATEIRLRADKPLCVMQGSRPFFLDGQGCTSATPVKESLLVTRQDLQEAFVSLCGWAVHSHQKELAGGYISVRGGHHAGIAASAVVKDGQISAVRAITSINLRIAREIRGAADGLVSQCYTGQTPGLLIAGAPASGKTTLLRDLARQLSSEQGGFRKVCVVDESGEIGGGQGENACSDLGTCSDLLLGYPKLQGLQIATRYLSPQVLICDEICTAAEIEAVEVAANSGVAVITSIHAASMEELCRKKAFPLLSKSGAFAYLALLSGAAHPAQIARLGRMDALCPGY